MQLCSKGDCMFLHEEIKTRRTSVDQSEHLQPSHLGIRLATVFWSATCRG